MFHDEALMGLVHLSHIDRQCREIERSAVVMPAGAPIITLFPANELPVANTY